MFRTLLISAVSLTIGTLACAGPTLEKDGLLRDGGGKTLYVFAKDTPGKSNCVDACFATWPAFLAKPEAQANGDLTLVVRADGGKQWALKGQALYYFVGDATVGDAKGDGMGGTWRVVRTGGTPAAAATTATPKSYD